MNTGITGKWLITTEVPQIEILPEDTGRNRVQDGLQKIPRFPQRLFGLFALGDIVIYAPVCNNVTLFIPYRSSCCQYSQSFSIFSFNVLLIILHKPFFFE